MYGSNVSMQAVMNQEVMIEYIQTFKAKFIIFHQFLTCMTITSLADNLVFYVCWASTFA